MKTRTVVFCHVANSPKIRLSAKVWKVQIKLPGTMRCNIKEEEMKTIKWKFVQVLN